MTSVGESLKIRSTPSPEFAELYTQALAHALLPLGLRTVASFALSHFWFSRVMLHVFEALWHFQPTFSGPEDYAFFSLEASALHTLILSLGFSLGQRLRHMQLSRRLHVMVLLGLTVLFGAAVAAALSYAFRHQLGPVRHFAARFFEEPRIESRSFRWPWQPSVKPPPASARGRLPAWCSGGFTVWCLGGATRPHEAFALVGSVTMSLWLLVALLIPQWDATKMILCKPVFQAKALALAMVLSLWWRVDSFFILLLLSAASGVVLVPASTLERFRDFG